MSQADTNCRLAFYEAAGERERVGKALANIGHVQECASLEADIHEGSLHPRKNRIHAAQVDVAHNPFLLGHLHDQFHQPAVFQHSYAGNLRVLVDDEINLC